MANLTIEFFSNSLNRPVTFKMLIPNDPIGKDTTKTTPMKVIFLLHGYTGAAGNWIPEEYATKHNFAIVMPSGENAFYVDGLSTGHAYGTFVAVELVDYIRKTFGLALRAEDTFIMGMSMGGFGAIKSALMYPDRFSRIIALSPAYIIHKIANMEPNTFDGMANYDYYHECFGDLSKVEESRNNPEVLIDELIAKGTDIPKLYMAIGTEDFLLEPVRAFEEFLKSRGVNHVYEESTGGHDMEFWARYARSFVPLLFEE